MATTSISTVDNSLHREIVLRPSSLGHQSQTISNRGSSRESPARTTPYRNMLVLVHTDHIQSVNVTTSYETQLIEPYGS